MKELKDTGLMSAAEFMIARYAKYLRSAEVNCPCNGLARHLGVDKEWRK